MSRLEIHGHVMETLLRRHYVSDSSWLTQFVMLALLSAFSTVLILRSELKRIPFRTSAIILTVLGSAFISFNYFNLRIPVSALTLTVLASSVATIFLRFSVLEKHVRQLQLSSQTKQAEETGSWELVRLSALQMFYPTRMVILELPAWQNTPSSC